MAERPLYTLYKNLKAQNYDVPDDYNKFESALTRDGKGGADNRHAIYENLKAQNFDVPSTYERFYSALFEPRSKTSSRAKGGSVPMSAADRARFLAGAQSVLNTARQVKRASGNIRKTVERAKKFNANDGKVTIGFKNPLQNQNVQKNEFNYNDTTGKTGTYTATDGVEFDNEYDAAQYQNKLDKYGEEWSNAVDMGIVPSELDKADPDLSDTDVAMRQMERRQEWLNENQDRRSKELNESMHLQGSPFVASGGAVAPSSFNTAISNEANRLSDVEYGAYNTAKAYNQMLRTTLLQELKEQRQRNENAGWWKDKWNDVSNYFGAFFNTMLDPKLYSQGVMDAAISNNLLQVKKGMEDGTIKKGSNAGNAAQAMLGAIQQQQGEAAKQQQYGTKAYQYGDMSGRSLKFMADFALSGWRNVMTTGFTKAGEKVGEKMALGALGKWFTKNTGRVLGDIAGSAALAATNQLGSTYNNVIERYVGMNNENGGVTQDKNGDLKFNEGVSLGKAIKDGFGSATIENFSEMFGEYLPGAPKLLSKLGLSKVSSFFEKIGNNAYYKWLSNATNKSGIQGVMAEISEEEFGTALHAAWGDGDGSWSDFNVFTNPDAREKQIDTCLGMFYSVGFMQAPRTAVGAINAVQYFNIKHQVAKADKFGQMMFNDKWDEIKSKIDVTTNADLTKTVLDATRSDSMTAKQKDAVINYAMFLSKLRGFNQAADAKTKDKVEEGDTAPTLSNDLDDAYTEGHNADDSDKHNIQLEQNDKANELAAMLHITPEQLHDMADEDLETMTGQDDKLDQAIYDYQVSTAKYQGVMDGAQDEVDMAAHQAAMETDNMTDLSRGTVRKATIKATGGLEDYEVYIISGNIATHDDGSIDVGNSDDMIIYYDPTTGRKEHADAMMFADLIEELPAADVKAQAINDAKENTIKKIAGIIDGTIEVGSQFSVTDADGTEHTYEVLADNGDGTAMITIDGNVPTELVKGENVQIPYSFADLQQMKDMEDQKRLEAAKAEREQMEKERAAQQTQETEQSQPSFDFNQILNDNGNVVLVDVLGKDGNTKYPDSRLFLIRDTGAKAKVVELKSDGTIVPHAVNKEDVATISSMSLDEYKQAMPESSMIEDNSGEESDEDSQLANLGLPKGSEIWMSGDGFGRPKENTQSKVVGIDEQGSIILEDKDGKKWSASFDYINNHRELPPLDENTNIVNEENNQSESNAEENTPAPEQTPAMTLEDGTIVPMLEDGNPDFSKLTAAQTAELYDTQFGEDADSIVSGYVSDAKKALDKANNMTVKGMNFVEQKAAKDAKEKAIADAQAAYDSAIAIRDAYNERQLAKVEDTAEGRKELIEKARRKFARLKSAVKDDAEAVSQIYRETIGSLLHRLYDSTGIDVTDTTPLTAEEYVASNLGAHSLNYEGTETSKGVKQETGLSREDFAKTQLLAADGKGTTIDALVHSLWENRPSNLESLDTQDIRNALIGVLNSGFKASEARNFVENIRIAQAENILEEQKRAKENAAYAEQHKAESEAELKAKSDEKAELKAKSEAKLDNESSNESNDLDNDLDNEKTNDKINDNISVPEDATDENPLGAERDESDLPFSAKENGKQQNNAERSADVEKNKVDDMKVVDNIVGEKTRKAFERLAKMMGANIQWQYSDKLGNGWIQETTDADGNVHRTIFITLDSSITEGAQFIFGHEMTHQIKNLNPAAYNELTQLVLDTYGSDAFDKAVDETMKRYSDAGFSGRARDYYAEEVVADAVGEMIRDLNLAHTLAMKMSHPLLAAIHEILQKIKLAFFGTEYSDVTKNIIRSIEQAYVKTANGQVTNSETGEDVSFSLRQKPEPKKKGVGYKVFVLKDGKLYPPMVANPDGAATPVGIWLDADAAPIAGESKTGRPQVKQGGKGTQGGSGKLAYRPGWHLGVVPYAIQFNRKDAEGNKTLFPKNFVFAEVEYAADVDYQEEARQEGINPSGKYQHSLAGLKHLPTDGYYMYRTNPNPETDPWVITGAMKVNRILTRAEQAELVKNAGREPQQIQEGDIVTDDVVNSINQEIADAPKFSLKVYHGSGADFTEFDFDHMGEGAGSQAFGWGGYVTSSKKIGKSYAEVGQQSAESRHAYSEDTPIEAAVGSILGQDMYNHQAKTFEQKKAQAIKNAENSIASFSDMLKNSNELDEKGKKFLQKSIEKDKKKLEVLRTLTEEQYKEEYIKQGRAKNLYEVNIPEDNGSNYIEFYEDATPEFKEQIKSVLANGLPSELKEMPEYKEAERKFYEENGTDESFEKSLIDDALFELERRKSNGDAYNALSVAVGDKLASKILSSLGYTGIKYPAGTIQGGAEEGDTNYVIFKPEDMRITEHTKFSLRLKSAIEETETNPSDAQKESGNYKKGHIKFGGYDYTIENPNGSTRSGKDADGKEWKVTMHDTYGYIRGKFGKDGDHLDMFINDKADLDNWNGDVFVVDQVNPDGSFDEHKVMYGYDSMDDAKKAYLANYSKGWQGLGNINGVSKDEFDKWLDTSNRKLKPFADYAKVKFSLKSKPVRFEAGKKLSDEEKKEVLSTLKDAYKVNGVPYHIEETAGGKEKRVYEPTADSYVVSDITNRPLRYYITLPDGRVAHPTEVYPNISDNEVKSSATKQGLLDEEVDQIVSAAIGNMKDISDNAKAIEVLTELQNLPHETHDVGYGLNHARSYNYKTGIFTSDAAQAIDYVVRRMRRKEDVPTEIPAALKKAVDDSYGMVDNLIDGMSTTKFSLKKVNDDFNQRLDELVKNPNQKDKILRFGRSSSFLKVGGITDAEIELDFDKFIRKSGDKYKNNHPFAASDLKNLPMALAEPIAVFNSTTANDHVVLTELQKDGKNFIVAVRAVEQHRKGGVVLEVNKITSLYPKEEIGIVYWINNGRISNVDKEKALHFIEAFQPHAGTTITDEELKSAANIINSFETTKENGEKVDVEAPKTFDEFLNHPSLKFSIKNEQQRKAAEDAYEYASKLRPNKSSQYALVNMSNPSSSPEYYEKKALADRWRRFYNKAVHNELDDVYKDAWGNYKLFDLDRPFADQVNEVKGDVPNEFNAPDAVANKNADNESGAEYHEYKQDEPSSITYKDRYKAFKQREANREKTAGLRKERKETEDSYNSKSKERVEYNKQLMKEYMDEHGLSSENDIPYDVWDNLRSKSFEKYQDELDSLFNKYKDLDKQIKAVAEPRFSLKDDEYLKAVGDGDMEKAQKMVNEAAKSAGYSTGSSYQGTSAFNGAAPWGNGYFLTKEERKEAWDNGEFEGESTLGDYINDDIDGGNLEELTNAASYRAADSMRKEAIDNVRNAIQKKAKTITMYRSVPSDVKEGSFRNGDWVTPSRAYAVDNAKLHGWGDDYNIIEQKVPVDDVWFDGNDIAEWGYGREEDYINDTDFAYKNSKNNKKLLDAVTYDDNGNVIPLSQRFNEKNKDVRFSLKDEKTLAGVHNITEEKLRKALKLGGFANPSLAVIDTNKSGHNNFGEISFIAPSALLDKRTGKTGGTWITDAYTQRYPSVERQMSEKGSQKFEDWVDSLEYPSAAKAEIKRQTKDVLEDNGVPAWELMYLKEKGIDIKAYDSNVDYRWKEIINDHPTAEDILSSMQNDPELNEKVTSLAKHAIIYPTWEKVSLEVRRKMYEETGVKASPINPQVRKQTKEIFERDYKSTLLNKDGSPRKKDVKKVVEDIVKEHNDTKKYDFYLSKVKASNYVNKNGLYDDYIRWQENKLDDFGTKNRIFRGYTRDGSRKYVPETLENVSKAMREEADGQTNGSEYTSFGSFIAKLASRVDSTDEMRANKDKLSSNKDKEEFYEKWSEVYYDLAKFLYNDVFYGEQRLHDIVLQSDPKKYAKKEYGITLTPTFMKKLDALKNAVQTELKSAYFETKYNRPLRLNEFAAAVVPDNLGEDVRKGIEDAGLPMYDYDPNKEGDRSRAFNEAINSSDNIRFSLKSMMEKPEGWKQANKKDIHIAEAIERDPKFSLKNLDGSLIKAGTYFSGGGLVEEGLKGIIDPVVAVEYDEKISGVYRNNFGQHIVTADVRDVDPKELVKQIDGEVEYFHASPVCKNYSQAKSNHAEVELDKETAASTAEFINAIKPKVVTIENVKGYKDSDAMKTITDALDANGYTWDADVYNAADYGGYTNRERLIVRAVLDGKLPEKPKKMAHKSGWYEAVADIIPTMTEKKNGVAPWMDIRLKADGIDWRNIDKPLYVMGSAYADGKIPHAFANELLPTLRTKSGDVIVMPDGKVYRAMGRVLARVSGVSDDYKMPFSENLSHTIIGNGIPTQLTEHVIAPLLQNTLRPTTPEDGNTKFSLRYDKFEHDLNQWKKDNNLPKDAQRPTIPQRNAGESAVDFLRRVDEYRKQMALWKTAPTYEHHLLSDDTALGEFNRELQRGSVLKRIAFQDSMLAIRKAQEAIMKEVGVDRLNMAEDAYTAENRSHGKGKNEFEEYNNEFLQPLRKAYHQMKKVLGDSYDNVRIYMMAKHGLERDAQVAFKKSLESDFDDVAKRSAAYRAYKGDMNRIINDSDLEYGRIDFKTWRNRDNLLRTKYSPSYMAYRYDENGIVFDYSGLSALFGGPDFEEAGHKLVRDIEDKYVTETHDLWDATNAATKKILRDGYKAGMMSKDTYQYVRDMYGHYIPLRGWDGTTADQVWDYVGGGKGSFNQTLKTAHGRTSIADDPIAYIENMAESGILLNNKNWVKQHLMLLAQNHPTSLLTLSKAWYVKSTDANGNEEWIPATPQITSQMNSNQVKATIDAFEKKMEQMAVTGDATQKRDGLNIAYPQTHSEEREHEVRVMKDGEEYVIYVNGDPQLAQAMNNTRAHRVREIQSGKLDRAAAWLGRKMAAAYTSLSPLFIPSNYFRDLTMTLASTAIREDGRYNYLLRKNMATSWNLGFMLRDYQNGKLREKVSNGNATAKEQMFYDFMINGGETGFVSSLDVEDLKKKFKNDLKDLDRWKANPVKVGHTIMDGIEFLNRMIEDSNRFAVYMTSIQYGRSIDEAVNDAKDVTLNFNRKGTGEYGWQMIRNLYLFINPAVQSLQTLGALVKHHPFKFTAVTASWLASGVLVPIVNAALMSMLGGDDDKDKYWQFTKWDRRNNLIMWVPFTHEYIKIPLAQEFRAFYGIGDMIASKMMGGELAEESWSQYAEDLLGQVVDMLPLDPTGYDGNIAVSLMPNAIRPVFELAFNVDFTGKPLFKETEYNKYDPNFTKAYVGTPDWLVRASRMVNSIGNDYPDVQQNSIDAFGDPRYNLNNPAVVDHVLSSYLGGAYTMGSQVLGVLTKSLNDPKEIKVADIPLFSKFVSNPDDRPVAKKQGDEFWNMKENHDRAANTLSKLKKQAKVDGDYSMLERFYGSEEYKQYKQDDAKVKKYEEDKKKERSEESGEEYRPHKLNAEDIYKAHATPKDDFEDLKLKQLYTKLNGFKTSYDLLVDTAPSQSDGYYNTNKAAIDAIDEISLDKQEISELKKGFLDDGKDAYNAEDMKQIRDLRKKILAVLEKANKVVVANQKAKAEK